MTVFLCLTETDYAMGPSNKWEHDSKPIEFKTEYNDTYSTRDVERAARNFLLKDDDFYMEDGDELFVYVMTPDNVVYEVACEVRKILDFYVNARKVEPNV